MDGHNALHALKIRGGDHEGQRHALLRRVRGVEPDATVFFDARDAPGHVGRTFREQGVRVVYCAHREADDEIIDTVRHSGEPGRFLVVSNDRELTGRSRQLGATISSVAAFFGRGQPPDSEEFDDDDPKPSAPAGKPFTPADFDLPDVVDLNDPDTLG